LPSVPSPVARVSDPTTVEKRATILILDNNAVNRTLICNTLEPAGYQVIEAITVQAAVTVARQALPDLILSDLHLPFEDGYDFIRAVRSDEVLRLIPFVFISSTGYLDKFKPFDRALAPHEFILRPIEPQALIAKIEACLTNVPSPRKRET
jgi:CheY-like chemotaxis protein